LHKRNFMSILNVVVLNPPFSKGDFQRKYNKFPPLEKGGGKP
jgi:hypothetical protein